MVGENNDEGGSKGGSSGQGSRLLSAIAGDRSAALAPNVVPMLKEVKSGKVNNLVLEDRLNEFIAHMNDLEALERITSTKRMRAFRDRSLCQLWTTSQMILLRRGNSLQMAKPFSVRSLELEVIHFGVHYVDLEHEDER